MRRWVFIIIAICLLVFIILQTPLRKFFLQDACLDAGGKWASNGDFCIYRNCADDNSCKPSYGNAAVCRSLSKGITKKELFFHLGMPDSQNNNVYFFTGGPSSANISAVIENDIVADLNCGK